MSVRKYFRKDRPVEIEQVDGIVAVRGARNGRLRGTHANHGFNLTLVNALEKAGWTLFKRPVESFAGQETAPVFRKGDRLLLGTPRLNVQFVTDPGVESAERMLGERGLRVLRKLPLAPGLYQAMLGTGDSADALDAANELREAPDVSWAEPEFLELIGPR